MSLLINLNFIRIILYYLRAYSHISRMCVSLCIMYQRTYIDEIRLYIIYEKGKQNVHQHKTRNANNAQNKNSRFSSSFFFLSILCKIAVAQKQYLLINKIKRRKSIILLYMCNVLRGDDAQYT